MSDKTLIDYVNQAKARWLQRVMYSSAVSSTGKVLAFAIFDHLNCITLDSWPSQATIADLIGRKASKTIQRCSADLTVHGFATVAHQLRQRSSCRYRPEFIIEDWDKFAGSSGQKHPGDPDKNVGQSSLLIHFESSSRDFRIVRPGNAHNPIYNPATRGSVEIRIAHKLGHDGDRILDRLASIDDAIISRLCHAFYEGLIGPREIKAARLAAAHLR